MKKVLIAIFALVYIATSTGAIVQAHYCMGKLADWAVGSGNSETCSKCGMKKSARAGKGCCNDERKFVKNDTDQKTTETDFQMAYSIAVALPVSFYELSVAEILSVTGQNPTSYAPPKNNGVAVYIRNCVFLI